MDAYLYHLHQIDPRKYSVEKGDAVHHHLHLADVDPVANVVGMLDEKKDARAQELLGGSGEYERQRKEGRSGADKNLDGAAMEEYHCWRVSAT